jgi:phage terminase large subunit
VGLARNELTTLKKTTMISFMEVLNDWGLNDNHYKYNSTTGEVKFSNGSSVVLMELSYIPSDPNYTRLGGQLLTFGCIDEAGELDERGKQIFQSRLGRWKNNETGIKPFLLMTCNPSKNFLYRDFYIPYNDNTLPSHRKFIQALITDNPFISDSYRQNLENTLTPIDKQRLIYGNWDYDSDPNSLMEYETILSIFTNKKPDIEKPKRYISADIAFTSDNAVIMIWEDLTLVQIIVNPEDKIEDVIREKAKEYAVPPGNISYDADGVGKYLMNYLKGAKAINNNSKAIDGENYQNLKTQLYFKLAEMINQGKLKVVKSQYDEKIIEELQEVKHQPTDKVGKIQMVDKGQVKRTLGRSPDFSDALAYRMIFELKKAPTRNFRIMTI